MASVGAAPTSKHFAAKLTTCSSYKGAIGEKVTPVELNAACSSERTSSGAEYMGVAPRRITEVFSIAGSPDVHIVRVMAHMHNEVAPLIFQSVP